MKRINSAKLAGVISGVALFFPYPAIPVGNRTGLQLGHLLVLGLLVLAIMSLRASGRSIRAFLLLTIPLAFPLVFVSQSSQNINATVMQVVALLTILVIGRVVSKQQGFSGFLYGMSFAVAVHAIVGYVQQYYYLSEVFPLAQLYVNPSFSEMDPERITHIYATYTKRSFGVFPEPSSMFAALAPWLILVAFMCSRDAVSKGVVRRNFWSKVVMMLSIGLMYFGRSGGLPYLVLGFVIYFFPRLKRYFARPTLSRILIGLVVGSILCFVGFLLYRSFETRAQAEVATGNSWEERLASILFGVQVVLNGSIANLLFGYGLGDIAEMTQLATGTASIHSVVVATFAATGLVGLACIGLVAAMAMRSIMRGGERALGVAIFVVWGAAVTLVTGYFQLLSVWACLAVMLQWDRIFPANNVRQL